MVDVAVVAEAAGVIELSRIAELSTSVASSAFPGTNSPDRYRNKLQINTAQASHLSRVYGCLAGMSLQFDAVCVKNHILKECEFKRLRLPNSVSGE